VVLQIILHECREINASQVVNGNVNVTCVIAQDFVADPATGHTQNSVQFEVLDRLSQNVKHFLLRTCDGNVGGVNYNGRRRVIDFKLFLHKLLRVCLVTVCVQELGTRLCCLSVVAIVLTSVAVSGWLVPRSVLEGSRSVFATLGTVIMTVGSVLEIVLVSIRSHLLIRIRSLSIGHKILSLSFTDNTQITVLVLAAWSCLWLRRCTLLGGWVGGLGLIVITINPIIIFIAIIIELLEAGVALVVITEASVLILVSILIRSVISIKLTVISVVIKTRFVVCGLFCLCTRWLIGVSGCRVIISTQFGTKK
jgi:hypothetical protein